MDENSEKTRDACDAIRLAFLDKHNPCFDKIIADLEWCINSYNYDRIPVGIYAKGLEAVEIAKEYNNNTNRIDEEIISNLEKCLDFITIG